MADPAPSAPLPDAAPESRVSPADQMAALTGEPVELSQPEAEEPAEDNNDASTARQIGALAAMAPFERTAPAVAVPSNDPTKHAPATTSNSAETPVSPPAPREPMSSAEPPRAPNATPPDPSPPTGVKPQQGHPSPVAPSSAKAQDHPNAVSRSPQGAAPLNATAVKLELDRRPQRQSGLEQERGAAVNPRLDLGGGLLPRLCPPQRPHALARERHADRQHAELRGPVAVPAGRHRAPLHLLELIARQAQNLAMPRREPE